MSDRDVVRVQLARPARSSFDVVARCHLGLPTVIAVPPFLDDGTPFPTRYWLTCPLAVRRIGSLESRGGVKAAEARTVAEPDFGERHTAAMVRYRRDRDALIPEGTTDPRPTGGVGGARAGVKCLHAHYADYLAGHDNPVGEALAPEIEPLNCTVACVSQRDGVTERNPDWRRPRHEAPATDQSSSELAPVTLSNRCDGSSS